jgi:hypothetical protein
MSFHSSGVKFDLSAIGIAFLGAVHNYHFQIENFQITLKVRQAYRSLMLIKTPSSRTYPKVLDCDAMVSTSEEMLIAVSNLSD